MHVYYTGRRFGGGTWQGKRGGIVPNHYSRSQVSEPYKALIHILTTHPNNMTKSVTAAYALITSPMKAKAIGVGVGHVDDRWSHKYENGYYGQPGPSS